LKEKKFDFSLINSQTGQALFKKCNAGNEVCSLDVSRALTDEQIFVNTITLDDFANKNHLSKIDILKIDTEGYEPLVFRGSKHLLQEHRIRLFIFEHLIGN
jgi:FkbM family methyltransferase